MNPHDTIPSRNLLLWGLVVVSIGWVLVQLMPSVFEVAELNTLDQRFAFRDHYASNPTITEEVFHVSLDDYSLAESGRYEWGRRDLARLILTMADGGADIIASDLLFSGYRDSTGDRALAEAVDWAANVILAYQGNFSDEAARISSEDYNPIVDFTSYPEIGATSLRDFEGFNATPYPELLRGAYLSGYVNLLPDRDGVVRRYPLVAETEGRLVPSIAMAALAAYLDYDLANVAVASHQVVLKDLQLPEGEEPQDLVIPLDGSGSMVINWPGRFTEENWPQSYSALDVLEVDNPRRLLPMFGGKVGILGDISTAGKDYGKAPLDNNFPFVFIYSSLLSAILQGDFLRYSPFWLDLLLLLLALLVLWRVAIRRSMTWLVIVAILISVAYTALVLLLFVQVGWILPVMAFMTPFVLLAGFTMFYKFYYEQRHLLLIREGLRSYLSPPLLERMEKNPDLLKPGGKRKYISVLFSDIANFTGFCDTNSPDEVQAVLDEYLNNMVGLVFQHEGIIDKYMGDGLLAFFENEEESRIVSPANSVRTAVAMQEGARRLREKWAAEGRLPIQIRVGIATGEVAVGNLGTKDKIDYTIIGSKVNLASRLQGKGESGDIVVDEETHSHILEEFDLEDMGELEVKGFKDLVRAYRLHP